VALAVALFAAALALIVSERIDRTKVALAGAALAVLLGLISQDEAIAAVDWAVIGLLAGMMILVWDVERTGIFTYLALRAARASGGRPGRLIVGLCLTTAVGSAFLDNVTMVLLVVPIALAVADELEIDAVPLIVAAVVASNIGGAATLIGDPPNIIIAGASGLSFLDFLVGVGPPALIALVVVTWGLLVVFRRRLTPAPERVAALARLDARGALAPRWKVATSLGVLGLTLAGFFAHSALGLEPATVALAGAALCLLVSRAGIEEPLRAIEWPTLAFFVGLFVLVGALEANGALERVADWLVSATGGSATAEALGIAWGSAIASGIVDNIPFTAAMTPVVERLGDGDGNWWALSMGACYGGNLTLVAASANLVAAGAARRAGRAITFGGFLRVGAPATLASMLVATAWLLVIAP
jgi:Na+/H+ antiporter NhaD/arsenite permease-like protein